MFGSKKRENEYVFKQVAREWGMSVSEVKQQLAEKLEEAKHSSDPAVQAEYRRYFGNKTPTPSQTLELVAKKNRKLF